MSFLRRLFGGGGDADEARAGTGAAGDRKEVDAERQPEVDAERRPELDPDEEERRYEREVMRAEAERLDPLRQRQLRYAEHAWTPPSQGGDRRADDEEAGQRG